MIQGTSLRALCRFPGLAFAVIDYGIEHNLIWVTALDAGGEIWCAPNPKVRLAENWTAGRLKDLRAEVGVQEQSGDRQ